MTYTGYSQQQSAYPQGAGTGGPKAGTNGTTVDAIKRRASNLFKEGQRRTTEAAKLARKKSWEYAHDRHMQVTAAAGAGGAVVVGTPSAVVGFLAGGAIGGAVGILPALFTFGLSIPISATIGAGCGMVLSGATGATVGFTGAGTVGYTAYAKRAQIADLFKRVGSKVQQALGAARTKVKGFCLSVASRVREKATILLRATKAKTVEIATNKDVQAATASAVGGAVVLGTGGAATGLATGGAIGAAVGLVPAIFTFGLSIPVCAVIGGGCGLAAGTAVGSTTGAVAGIGGYATYKRREAIRSSIRTMAEMTSNSAKKAHAMVAGKLQKS